MQTMLPGTNRPTSPADFTSALRYPDASKRWALTRRAMQLYLHTVGEVDSYQAPGWRLELENLAPVYTNADYAYRMAEVRQRAVDEWEANQGENCTAGTNRFLGAFNLDYLTCDDRQDPEDNGCGYSDCDVCKVETTKFVTVQVTLRFEVTNEASEDSTYYDVQRYLRLEQTGNVDDVSEETMTVDDIRVSTCCHSC